MSLKLIFFLVLVSAFVFRVLLIPVARHGDINNNTSWGQLLLQRGPQNFYEGEEWTYSAPNQPPLYLYTFATTSFLQNATHNLIQWANERIPLFPSKTIWWFDSFGELYIAKLPGIIADLGIALCIYYLLKGKKGVILSTLWLLNPVSWYNSAIWGGTDSIVNLLGLISIYSLYRKKLSISAFFLSLSFLFKGSLLVLLPIYLLYALRLQFKISDWMKAVFVSVVAFLVITFPFHPSITIFTWFFNLYTGRFLPGEIGTLTANAFNFWWIINPGPVLDNTLFFGVTARVIGLGITGLCMLSLVLKNLRTKMDTSAFLSFSLLSLSSFLFMTRIHERYSYPFFPLATISLAFFPWLWIPYIVLSGIHLLNLYHLFWAPGIPAVQERYTDPQFALTLSVLNIVLFLFVVTRYLISKKHLTRGK